MTERRVVPRPPGDENSRLASHLLGPPILDRRHWANRDEWPVGNEGWLYLGEALHRVGAALNSDEWHGNEPLSREGGADEPRLKRAMTWLADRCRSNEIQTGCQFENGTRIQNRDSSLWTVPRVSKRFRKCGYYPSKPAADFDGDLEHAQIFIADADLTTAIAGLPHTSMSVTHIEIGRFSPYLQYAVELARRWDLTSPVCRMSREEMSWAIKEAWKKNRGSDLSGNTADSIRQLLRFPDEDAIRKGSRGPKAKKMVEP